MFLFLVVLLAATTAMTIRQMNEIRRLQEMRKRPKIVTVEQCGSSTITRDFKDGDYVGMASGTCTDGSVKRIVGIYAIKEEGKKKGSF